MRVLLALSGVTGFEEFEGSVGMGQSMLVLVEDVLELLKGRGVLSALDILEQLAEHLLHLFSK